MGGDDHEDNNEDGGRVEPNDRFGSKSWGDYKVRWRVTYVPVFSAEARPLTSRSTDMKKC